MKKTILLLFIAVISFSFTTTVNAQEKHEAQYEYPDSNTGVIYQLYLRFNGYQVNVWMKDSRQKEWSTCTVTHSNDETISFKLGQTQYHIQLDPNNEAAVVLYSADYASKWTYYKKQ